jgi:hypothetical protein
MDGIKDRKHQRIAYSVSVAALVIVKLKPRKHLLTNFPAQ